MIQDISSTLQQISSFLGCSVSEEFIRESVLPEISFIGMKSKIQMFQPVSVHWKPNFSFIRKGVVGDGEEYFGPAEQAEYQHMLDEYFKMVVDLHRNPDTDSQFIEWVAKFL